MTAPPRPRPIGVQYRHLTTLALALALSGCSGAGASSMPPTAPRPAAPSAASSAPASTTPSASPEEPAPSPSRPFDLVFSTERDGIRASVSLERNPLPSGQATWLTASVTNMGSGDVVWFHGGCRTVAIVSGSVGGVRFRLGRGHDALGATFKLRVLRDQGIPDGVPIVVFTPEPYIGKGRYTCADIGIEERILPGETISERSQWDGRSGVGLAPSPAGPVTLTAGFSYFWRAGKGQPASITDQVIRLTIPSWVVKGRDRSLLDPGEVVDAALDSPQFAAWLPTVGIGDGNQTVLRYDAAADRWEVGILDTRASAFHVVPVDPATGFVGPFIDRAWDPRVDGNP